MNSRLLLFLFIAALSPLPGAVVQQPALPEPGVTGYVLAPDGSPVSSGRVVAQSGMTSATASIDSNGRFRLVPPRSGFQQLIVSVPGQVPYRVNVTMPASKALRLPVIRLDPGAYFRVRLVSSSGEPIIDPQIRRRLFDLSGRPYSDAIVDRAPDPRDNDGGVTIGPLPRGIMTAAVDMPFFAQTRLPDVNVGDTKLLDGGTIAIQQPGAVLHVDVVDGMGAPVANHDVSLDDPRERSPLAFRPARTNQQGRATFERLAAGRYRVWTTAVDRCAGILLTTWGIVAMPANGSVEIPIVIGGRATFHLSSGGGPTMGARVFASPDVPPLPLPFARRVNPQGCPGATDSEGRVRFMNFPPGPAHVDVRLTNSTYVRQVNVPSDGREVAVAIPDGFAQAHVVSARNNQPVAGATVTWIGNGARVIATATASGDVLLEGVGTAGGALEVSAQGYQPLAEQLTEPPGLPHNVALVPVPPERSLRPRVVATSGEPVPNAVIELVPANLTAVPGIAVTDGRGVAAFSDVPPGSLRLIASADGFVTSTMRVDEDGASEVVVPLSRGYRVAASVELPGTAGPQQVRVLNDANASMDSFLDGESDRRVEPRGRLSLGPLAPGAYVIQLDGAGRRHTQHIRIVDRDVFTTFQ